MVLPPTVMSSRPFALYRGRRFLQGVFNIPCYVQSDSNTWHYLSQDGIDDIVLREMVGALKDVYFPSQIESLRHDLENGGTILDLGGFCGGWTAEMLSRFPGARSVVVEMNREKCVAIRKTLGANRLSSCARICESAIGDECRDAWLITSEDGSWGNYVSYVAPSGTTARKVVIQDYRSLTLGKTPIVVKCNCEGGEYPFVRSLANDKGPLPRFLIMMAHPEHGNVAGIRDDLVRLGYSVTFAINSDTRPCLHAWLQRQSP
jgi:hypothetical protein